MDERREWDFRDSEDVRRMLQRELEKPVDPRLWQFLVEDRDVEQCLGPYADVTEFNELLKRYKRLEQLKGDTRHRPTTAVVHPRRTEKWELLSILRARMAGEQSRVKAFRRKHLPDGLLSPAEVDAWIMAKAREDGPPSSWLTIPVPRNHRQSHNPDLVDVIEPSLTVEELPPRHELTRRFLYWVDKDSRARILPIAAGAVLDDLYTTVQDLASYQGWDQPKAVMFVLTGRIPYLYPLQYSVDFYGGPGPWARASIRLRVDADLSPSELVGVYRIVRQKIRPGRNRPISRKIRALVSFILTHPEGTWEEKMELWNGEHPQWKYEDIRNFCSHYHRAVRRLFPPLSKEIPYLIDTGTSYVTL